MYLSLNWLKDFVEIPKAITPDKLGLLLTMHTVEIDSVEKQADKFKGVIIGKILSVSKHPNADRLQLAKVDTGKDNLNIVCGAPNIEAGQLVPVAMVGAILPNGMEIKEADVRGEKSQGMLCAEDELGLGSDHAGIMILDKKAKIGQNFGAYLDLDDIIYEVDNKSITHRPDLWSHFGIAREISVFLDSKFKDNLELSLDNFLQKQKNKIETNLRAEIKDFKKCPRYMAIKVEGVEVKESQKWMQDRLIAVGMRPINNIVDITNYVMLELGQPLHAFNADDISEIIIRQAKKGEVIKTLDGNDRELDNDDLVITDKDKAIALAGVMGGENSEVNDETKEIIIESANFEPYTIRKTAQKFNLRTEAAVRFEKSLDPNLCELALIRVLEFLKETCPNMIVSDSFCDESSFELNQGPINFDLEWANTVIGCQLDKKQSKHTLEKLGFKVEEDDNSFSVMVPTWRATKDVSIPEDLIEEISRIYGYDNLTPSMPKVEMLAPDFNQERIFERKVKNILAYGAKLSEVYNYSFVGEEQLEKLGINHSQYLKLANPISKNHTLLKQNLTPNLLSNIKVNQARYEEVSLFEIGSVFFNLDSEINKDNSRKENIPYQEKRIGIIVAKENKKESFSTLKGIVEYLSDELNNSVVFEEDNDSSPWADKEMSTRIISGEDSKDIGWLCSLSDQVAKKVGIKKQVSIVEIRLIDLFNIYLSKGDKVYRETPKYPPVVRDLAFVVDSKILYNKIKEEIENFNELIKEVDLFDVYEGDKLGKNKKSLAFRINYLSEDKTLTSDEVDKIQKSLSVHLNEKFEAQIRDF